jgi:hypothetical protein
LNNSAGRNSSSGKRLASVLLGRRTGSAGTISPSIFVATMLNRVSVANNITGTGSGAQVSSVLKPFIYLTGKTVLAILRFNYYRRRSNILL